MTNLPWHSPSAAYDKKTGLNGGLLRTRPEFPTKPIKPGKKGKIKVTYSPIGRPGAFKKSVKIKTNGSTRSITLNIEGTVIPKK